MNNNKNAWTQESIDEIISKALEVVECKPIIKNAVGRDWEFDNKEIYLDDGGEVLKGYLTFQEVLLHERGIDGSIEVYKEVFLIPKGEHVVFFTTVESNYDNHSKTRRCRINRIFPVFQTLSLQEEEEFIWGLMSEINERNG